MSNYLTKAARLTVAGLILAAAVATPASGANGVRPMPHANGVVRLA